MEIAMIRKIVDSFDDASNLFVCTVPQGDWVKGISPPLSFPIFVVSCYGSLREMCF
jgi:hypothetical protein